MHLVARIVSSLASHCQEKASLEQRAKARPLVGKSAGLHLLHVVMVMMMVVADVVAMMMVVTMMLRHRGRVRARRADHRHREG